MARVAVLCADLLFGSKLQGGLTAAGHDVALVGAPGEVSRNSEVVLVDLASDAFDGPATVREMKQSGLGAPLLGFYPHVDAELRDRALESGTDRVVPRSRMARDMAALVDEAVGV